MSPGKSGRAGQLVEWPLAREWILPSGTGCSDRVTRGKHIMPHRLPASKLDAGESRAILPVEMSVENQHGFAAGAMAGLGCQPVSLPVTRVVAAVMAAVSSPIQNQQ